MKNLLGILVFSILATSCQKNFDEQCVLLAKEHTLKICPQQIGKDIVMDSMVYTPATQTMAYYHTLSNELDNEQNIKRNLLRFRNGMVENIQSSVELRQMKEKKVNFCYAYRSKKTKKEIIKVLITPKDYFKN
ncbi:MAG: hypothetical protein RR280_03505 [Bacteroidaceae bacterium]